MVCLSLLHSRCWWFQENLPWNNEFLQCFVNWFKREIRLWFNWTFFQKLINDSSLVNESLTCANWWTGRKFSNMDRNFACKKVWRWTFTGQVQHSACYGLLGEMPLRIIKLWYLTENWLMSFHFFISSPSLSNFSPDWTKTICAPWRNFQRLQLFKQGCLFFIFESPGEETKIKTGSKGQFLWAK